MEDLRSRGVLATRVVPHQYPLPPSDDASLPTREGERFDANPARARRDPVPRAPRSPQRRRRSARLTSPKPSVSRESDPLHLLADAVDLEVDGDEKPNPAAALTRRVDITRAAILEEVTWIHQTRRARDELARVRDETRARVSVRADCPDDNPALDAAHAVALGAFARRSETRWREQIERESERAVEDRRRQRHVDARLTRLEDAVAALTRKRALEEKADAERTAAAAAAVATKPGAARSEGLRRGGCPGGTRRRRAEAAAGAAAADGFSPVETRGGILRVWTSMHNGAMYVRSRLRRAFRVVVCQSTAQKTRLFVVG